MIVDDQEEITAMLGDLVQSFGYQTMTARDAVQALRAVHDFALHVVLLDIAMPGIGGETVLQQLRVTTPDLPVVVVTGTQR